MLLIKNESAIEYNSAMLPIGNDFLWNTDHNYVALIQLTISMCIMFSENSWHNQLKIISITNHGSSKSQI